MPDQTSAPLDTRGLSAGYGGRDVLEQVDFSVPHGKVTSIIGPNGCGKSTLLKVVAGLLKPTAGEVRVAGRSIQDLRPKDLAQDLAVLPQSPQAPDGMTVADLVMRGRAPHQPWYRTWSPGDDEIVTQAMTDTGVDDLADRPLEDLSGGQRQRAWIAMTLAQQTPLLLLDEPTTHLDLAHAVDVMDRVVRLRQDTGRTIVTVMHDLSLAARYSDHLVVMRDGQVQTQGAPHDVLTAKLLHEVFGLRAHVFPDPVDGLMAVVPAATPTASSGGPGD